jgi:hypothetical protein
VDIEFLPRVITSSNNHSYTTMFFIPDHRSSDIGEIAKFQEHGAQAYRPTRPSEVPIFATSKTTNAT